MLPFDIQDLIHYSPHLIEIKRGNYAQKNFCKNCGSNKISLTIVNTSERVIEGGLPSLFKITFKKNVNHLIFHCLQCNDVFTKKLEL